MTREGYTKHKELIEKWAEGKEIEYYSVVRSSWQKVTTPAWKVDHDYRICKPSPEYIKSLYFDWYDKLPGGLSALAKEVYDSAFSYRCEPKSMSEALQYGFVWCNNMYDEMWESLWEFYKVVETTNGIDSITFDRLY